MSVSHKPENRNKSHAAHPSLGKATNPEGLDCTACHNTRDCLTFETNAHGVCICCACLNEMAGEDRAAFWDTGIL